jgi:CheY-like chemotaxis protein
MGKEAMLVEALSNLILNAVDAMPAGGMITIRTIARTDEVVVEVVDTGCGMSATVLKRCCEPFFSTKGPHATGLGLAMVYGILHDHGGDVAIESAEGRGTTVALRLPTQVGAAIAAAGTPDKASARPLRILVIDDDQDVCAVLRTYFQPGPHRADIVNKAGDGLRAFDATAFDLVITDRAMPEMSGDQLAAEMKRRKPSVPIVMLTGFGDAMKETAQCPPGVDRVLSKPITVAELRQAINEVVSCRAT